MGRAVICFRSPWPTAFRVTCFRSSVIVPTAPAHAASFACVFSISNFPRFVAVSAPVVSAISNPFRRSRFTRALRSHACCPAHASGGCFRLSTAFNRAGFPFKNVVTLLLPFRSLQGRHAQAKLPGLSVPPAALGTTWSSSNRAVLFQSPRPQ